MNPNDVDPALVEKAARAMWNAQTRQPWQQIDDGDEWPSWVDLASRDRLREKVRAALAAVLPDYAEQQRIDALETAAKFIESQRSTISIASRALDMGRAWSAQVIRDSADLLRAARLTATTEETTP